MASADVAVVGGGVIGCAAAWYLARAGLRVDLWDRGPLGGEATAASAGILAPLAESVTPGPFVDLALAGLRAFAEDIEAVKDDSGLDPEYRRCGVLRVAVDGAAAVALHEAAGWQANARLNLRWLEPRQVATLEPGLASCHGGLLSPAEGHVHPVRLSAALAAAAYHRGAALHPFAPAVEPWMEGGRLRGLFTGGERRGYDLVVLAAGAWSAGWAAALSLRIPVRPVKGQMLIARTVAPPVRHVVFAGHSYLVPRADGTTYIGATQEEAGWDTRVTAGGIAELTAGAIAAAPALRDAEIVSAGAGLRPASVDGLPVIGAIPGCDGLIVAAGHFRNGILMCLVTGRIIAALAGGNAAPLPLEPFSPGRFAVAW